LSKGRLTRDELSWLLTQEAQNAAERLRVGVQLLRTQAPPPATFEDPTKGVETSLDALDDAMRMLSTLNQRAPTASAAHPARRGRIDLAALVVDVAPGARVSIEPGSGTEVYGDEVDLRRMLQILISHGSGDEASVHVRGDDEDVRVSVTLGPDLSPSAETERAWLSRIALRYGGRHELEGGSETLVLPADGALERSESAALRKELDVAKRQGEFYARELAAVFDRGDGAESSTSLRAAEPHSELPSSQLSSTLRLCAGLASELRAVVGPGRSELASLRASELTEAHLDALRGQMARVLETVTGLSAIGELHADERATRLDLVAVVRSAARALGPMAERDGIGIHIQVEPEGSRVSVHRKERALSTLVREVLAHAIAASPRGSTVEVSVAGSSPGVAARLHVRDAGAPVPAVSHAAFLALEAPANTFGRPSALPLFLASELAVGLRAALELSDASGPTRVATGATTSTGLRVSVAFADP
jgi:two-component system OmpR family sensor kinase